MTVHQWGLGGPETPISSRKGSRLAQISAIQARRRLSLEIDFSGLLCRAISALAEGVCAVWKLDVIFWLILASREHLNYVSCQYREKFMKFQLKAGQERPALSCCQGFNLVYQHHPVLSPATPACAASGSSLLLIPALACHGRAQDTAESMH